MNKLFNKKIYFLVLIISAVLLPHSVFASTVYVDTNQSNFFVDDTILVSVRVDSENKDINVVEGQIFLNHSEDTASLTDINISGSKFSLWPNKPLPSIDNTSISFTAGSPGGLISKDAIIFNMVLKLKEVGQIKLVPNYVRVYLNDGKGTRDEAKLNHLTINVLPKIEGAKLADDWSDIILNDKKAPESFKINLGKDASIFNNQYFISFFTTDSGSGVAYYEVQEGEGDFLRVESPYLLHDQSLRSLIKVKVVDKAGNERVEEFTPSAKELEAIKTAKVGRTALFSKNILLWIVLGLIIISIFVIINKKRRK